MLTDYLFADSTHDFKIRLIETGLSYMPQQITSFTETACNEVKDFFKNETLLEVAKTIYEKALLVFKIIVATYLIASNATIFGIGVLFAFCAPKMALELCNRVQETWEQQSLPIKSIIVAAGIVIPVTHVISAFLVGAYLCCQLQPAKNFI